MTCSTRSLKQAALVALGLLAASAAVARATTSPRLERQVLEALSPAQARAFAEGADPTTIVLADGSTLDRLLARAVAESGVQLAFTPLDPCVVVRTAGASAGALADGEARAFRAREGLAGQGGAGGGCGVPAEARALSVIVRVTAARGKGSLRVGPAGAPEPKIAVLDYGAGAGAVAPLLIELCEGPSCASDFQVRAVGAGTHLRIDVVGYFAPVALTQGAKGDPGPAGPKGDAGPAGPAGAVGAPGASCTVVAAAGNATLICPDGSSVTWVAPAPPPPPPVFERSFQVETPEIAVPAIGGGGDDTFCYHFRTPNTQTAGIRRWSSVGPAGTAYVVLFTAPQDVRPPGTLSPGNCMFQGSALEPGSWVYDGRGASAELVMPGDDGAGKPVAMEIAPNTPAYLVVRFLRGPNPIQGKVTLTAEALAAGVAYTTTHTLTTFNSQISIPPLSTGDVESFTCDTPADATFWRLSTFTHGFATRSEIKDGPSVVFETTDFRQPGAATFGPPGFFTFSTDELTYTCTYDNLANRTIQTGIRDDLDELCVAVTHVFPATRSRFCVNDVLLP
jgi:hypothetical protein